MNDECCGPWWKMVNHLQLKRLAPDHYGLRVVMRYMAAMAAHQDASSVAEVFAVAAKLGLGVQDIRDMGRILANRSWKEVAAAETGTDHDEGRRPKKCSEGVGRRNLL